MQPKTEQQQTHPSRHARWVRICHWIVTVSFITLVFTGVVILMAHPRLYWGDVGNDLTPALLELPISRNHRHGGWASTVAFFQDAGSPVTASRTYDIFNKNGWGRSLHFLAGWVFVLTGLFYLIAGILSRHLWRHVVPRAAELRPAVFLSDPVEHAQLRIETTGGAQYGTLQKCSYLAVIFVVLPLAVLTGFAMSPAITAAVPFLSSIFGGFQSARTIHFFTFVVLLLFLLVHVLMVIKSGFKRQIRGMTLGEKHEQ